MVNTTLFRLSTLAVALTAAQVALAQPKLEEVLVTAQKRAQDIQDVPISITAFSGAYLEENGVKTVEDVARLTPNFTISNSSQQTNNRIAIRGIGSVGNSGIEPSVGVFIDGVYYPRPGAVIGQLHHAGFNVPAYILVVQEGPRLFGKGIRLFGGAVQGFLKHHRIGAGVIVSGLCPVDAQSLNIQVCVQRLRHLGCVGQRFAGQIRVGNDRQQGLVSHLKLLARLTCDQFTPRHMVGH